MPAFKYRAKFDSVIFASSNFDSPTPLISKASIDCLRPLIPASVDLSKNIDLVGCAFNAAVINQFNKNGDGVCASSAVAFQKYFVHKPCNIEHKKEKVVGHIVNSGFSSFGENCLLTENDIANRIDPFNLTLAAVVYKTVNKDFANALIDSGKEDSPFYRRISASWEIGFNDYILAIGSRDLKDAEIISDSNKIRELSKFLLAKDGAGCLDDGTPIYRLITGRIYPLGIGFTTNPAAAVNGIAVESLAPSIENEEEDDDEENEDISEDHFIQESIEVDTLSFLNKFHKNFSQKEIPTVLTDNNTQLNNMDLEKIIAAIKAALSEKQADTKFSEEAIASVSKQIADHIRAKNDEYKAQVEAKEKAAQEAVAASEKLRTDVDKTTKELSETAAKLQKLEAAIATQAKSDLFNVRMAELDAEYDFDDEDRQILASDLNALDETVDSFAAFKKKMAVVYKGKCKTAKAALEKEINEKVEAKLAEKLKELAVVAPAVVAPVVAVETALASAKVEPVVIPNSVTPTEKPMTWQERVRKNFTSDKITVKL